MEAEHQLIEEIRCGNKEAFRHLVNPLVGPSYRSALAILKSPQLAEEAVQNSLIESYAAIMSGKKIHHFKGWFSRLIANRSLDIARKEKMYKYSLDIGDVDITSDESSPLEDILKKEQSVRLVEAVMALDLNFRAVIGLYYFQELSIEEIASLLAIKEGTVKSRLYHARLKLSSILRGSYLQTKEVLI